jgi:starch synthase
MKILFVASEMAPLAQAGGLAEVTASLPIALRELGHDVRVMLPGYEFINKFKLQMQPAGGNLSVPVPPHHENIHLESFLTRKHVQVYLLNHAGYFKGREIYGRDELEKFLFFTRAATGSLPYMEWQPQVIHCHDWHTALLPLYIKSLGLPYRSVFTIHNLAYQGWFGQDFMHRQGLEEFWREPPGGLGKLPLNFMSQGILQADHVTTVSPTYAREITTPTNGEGLDAFLRYRGRALEGIVNGIDYERYNPATDQCLKKNYDQSDIEKKLDNKLSLQERMGLEVAAEVPLIGIVQRLDEQKGIDILQPALDEIMALGAQIVILGKGQPHYENILLKEMEKHGGKLRVTIDFNETIARQIYAGCDIFLMPSRFEPCGLGQLIAMRYGSVPLVRHTGGLADTVPEFNDALSRGNGFVFYDYSTQALVAGVKQAVSAFADKVRWRKAARRIMQMDFSWGLSAKKYEVVYNKLP